MTKGPFFKEKTVTFFALNKIAPKYMEQTDKRLLNGNSWEFQYSAVSSGENLLFLGINIVGRADKRVLEWGAITFSVTCCLTMC